MKSIKISDKILNLENLPEIISELKYLHKTIAFTNGCFDILHYGHIQLLIECASLADILIVGVNSDISVKHIKGLERPINNEKSRTMTLSSLLMVDYVVLFNEDTPIELIKNIRPDILLKGGDWTEDKIVGSDFVRSYNGIVKVIPYIKGYSTTETISKIEKL
jgi:D-beta-D-heptose 7-phosphate kinase/D-beta-D-heptose 1-phosphate adenosyltransferase